MRETLKRVPNTVEVSTRIHSGNHGVRSCMVCLSEFADGHRYWCFDCDEGGLEVCASCEASTPSSAAGLHQWVMRRL